jgi:PPOX class probable FMN-dependent enzyme
MSAHDVRPDDIHRSPPSRAVADDTTVHGVADLDALYAPPAERIQKAVLDRLVDIHLDFLKAATFFCLATGSADGLDASPRGGPPGFVHVLDAHTVAFADWPGNNRIESLRNLARDERLGMVFLFPGQEIFLRINGRGRISTAPELLAQLSEGERVPKAATVVAIDQVLLHCGKAINRARLWAESSQLASGTLPTVGQVMAAFAKRENAEAEIGDAGIAEINAHYAHAVRHDLY